MAQIDDKGNIIPSPGQTFGDPIPRQFAELAIERATDYSGAYQRVDKGMRPLKRYTVYVLYPHDASALALDVDGLDDVPGSIEEIDVNAEDRDDAEIIAGQALRDDYEQGGKIVRVEERIGWYM